MAAAKAVLSKFGQHVKDVLRSGEWERAVGLLEAFRTSDAVTNRDWKYVLNGVLPRTVGTPAFEALLSTTIGPQSQGGLLPATAVEIIDNFKQREEMAATKSNDTISPVADVPEHLMVQVLDKAPTDAVIAALDSRSIVGALTWRAAFAQLATCAESRILPRTVPTDVRDRIVVHLAERAASADPEGSPLKAHLKRSDFHGWRWTDESLGKVLEAFDDQKMWRRIIATADRAQERGHAVSFGLAKHLLMRSEWRQAIRQVSAPGRTARLFDVAARAAELGNWGVDQRERWAREAVRRKKDVPAAIGILGKRGWKTACRLYQTHCSGPTPDTVACAALLSVSGGVCSWRTSMALCQEAARTKADVGPVLLRCLHLGPPREARLRLSTVSRTWQFSDRDAVAIAELTAWGGFVWDQALAALRRNPDAYPLRTVVSAELGKRLQWMDAVKLLLRDTTDIPLSLRVGRAVQVSARHSWETALKLASEDTRGAIESVMLGSGTLPDDVYRVLQRVHRQLNERGAMNGSAPRRAAAAALAQGTALPHAVSVALLADADRHDEALQISEATRSPATLAPDLARWLTIHVAK